MITCIISEPYLQYIDEKVLERAAQAVLIKETGDPDNDLSIVIDGDEQLQELNLEYLGIDAPTDVLSFPSGEQMPNPETGKLYLGDVIISYPRAMEQADATGETTIDEIQLLVVHGVLHLLGHDHAEAGEKREMWEKQASILSDLGVKITRLPE